MVYLSEHYKIYLKISRLQFPKRQRETNPVQISKQIPLRLNPIFTFPKSQGIHSQVHFCKMARFKKPRDSPRKIITKCGKCKISIPGLELYHHSRDDSCLPLHVQSARRRGLIKTDYDMGEVVQSNFLFDTVRYRVHKFSWNDAFDVVDIGYEYVIEFKMSPKEMRQLALKVYHITKTYTWMANRYELALAMLYQYRFKCQYLFFMKYLRENGVPSEVTVMILRKLVDITANTSSYRELSIVYKC